MLPATPDQKKALFQKARAHRAAGRTAEAIADLQRLILSEPKRAELRLELSHAAFDHGDPDQSLEALEQALTLAPDTAKLWMIAAARFQALRQSDRALHAYDRAAALEPKNPAAKVEKARLQQILGDFDSADKSFRALLKRYPEQTEIYRIALGSRKLGKGDPLIRQMLKLWKDPRLNDHGRVSLGYALAKAMEDSGATDKVFAFLNAANAAQRRLAPFDPDQRRAEWQRDVAAQADLPVPPMKTDADPRLVFVCGLPRSGTTLVEQIIAAHSAARAGGEMGHALLKAHQMLGLDKPLRDTAAESFHDWATAVMRLAMRDAGPGAGVITEKAIQSHRIFGLIHRTLPGARLIVVHRDPRDIALSVYKNHFATGAHRYANDLADIAGEIRLFRDSIAYWKAQLPGAIHEVHYEELVADAESQSRALIAAAGLDWEDGCLRFHEAKGAVQTLSIAQVRQPIHAGRRQAWKAYETELQPFIQAWGDAPWD